MTGGSVGVLIVLCSVCVDLVGSSVLAANDSWKCRERYGYRYYYDHGTEHCEQCREICQNAELMGTEQQCKAECAQYLEAIQCSEQEDRFYDDVVDKCSPCSELCDNHQVTGNTLTCREKCNGYLEKLTPKQVPSLHRQNYLKAMDGSDAAEESSTLDLLVHPGWIAAMVVGGLALVCVVVVIIVFYRTCRQQQYGPAPQEDRRDGDRGQELLDEQRLIQGQEAQPMNQSRRPVEETSQGSSQSQHFAIDGAGGVPTAFAELPRNTSDQV